MEKIEFHPFFWTPGRIILIVTLALVTFIIEVPLQKAILAYYQNPIPQLGSLAIFLIGTIFMIWLIFVIMTYSQIKNRKIIFEYNTLQFWTKSLIGTWQTKSIQLNEVKEVTFKQIVVPLGRGAAPIQWLVFTYKSGHSQEIGLYGFDTKVLKEMVSALNEKYPTILWDTPFYKNNPLSI